MSSAGESTDYRRREISISVIMPVYNEAATIREITRRVAAVPQVREIVMVDDCSTDGTRDLLRRLRQEHDTAFPPRRYRLKIIYHDRNRGKGASIRTGIQAVTEPVTIVQDADLEYSPEDYPNLVQPIADGIADVVYGSRFVGFPRRVLFFWHEVANRFLTFLSNMTTNLNLTDMETGYKMFKTEILKGIRLDSNRFGFEPEITAKIAKLGLRVYEVPISYHGRGYEEGKKITWKDGLAALWFIFKYWIVEDVVREDGGHYALQMLHKAGRYNEWLYQRFAPHVGDRVLEIGAGVGSISRFLLSRDSVTITDVSDRYLTELGRIYGGFHNVRVQKFDLARSLNSYPDRYDTVVCLNVIEHIEDDMQALSTAHDLLEPGGKLILYAPAMRRLYSDLDRRLGHHRRYELPGLSVKLKKAGFEIVYARYYNILGALGWLFNGQVLRRRHLPSRQVRFFDRLMPLVRLEDKLSPQFGLSLMVIARKPME